MKRTFIMVLDSFGIGASADAKKFGDEGADTLGHIAEACARGEANVGRSGPLTLPNLSRLGLGKAAEESTGTFLLAWIRTRILLVLMATPASCLLVKIRRQVTGKLRVSPSCSIGDISAMWKTAFHRNCWINW